MAENGAETARDTRGSLLVLEIMLYAEGGQFYFLACSYGFLTLLTGKSSAVRARVEALASSYPSEDPARPHPIDPSRIYKSLPQGGHFSHSGQSYALPRSHRREGHDNCARSG